MPFPFADFNIYSSTVMSCNHEYNLSFGSPSSESLGNFLSEGGLSMSLDDGLGGHNAVLAPTQTVSSRKPSAMNALP